MSRVRPVVFIVVGALSLAGCGGDDGLSAEEVRYARAYEQFCVKLDGAGGDIQNSLKVGGLSERRAFAKVRRTLSGFTKETLEAYDAFGRLRPPASLGDTLASDLRGITTEAERVFVSLDRALRRATTLDEVVSPLERFGKRLLAIDQSSIKLPERFYDEAPTCKKGLQEDQETRKGS